MVGCRKLSRIPFPFPHAQMVTATLLLFTLFLPVMIAAFIKSPYMAALLSAMTQVSFSPETMLLVTRCTLVGIKCDAVSRCVPPQNVIHGVYGTNIAEGVVQVLYWGTHEVARELEDPFLIWGTTYNCLPFSSMQWSFNEDILAFAYSVVRPPPALSRCFLVLNLPENNYRVSSLFFRMMYVRFGNE